MSDTYYTGARESNTNTGGPVDPGARDEFAGIRPNAGDVDMFLNLAKEGAGDFPRLPVSAFTGDADYETKSDARKAYTAVQNKADDIRAKIAKATNDVNSVLNDDRLYPDGRRRIAEQMTAANDAEISEAIQNLEAQGMIAAAQLHQQVMPKPPAKDAGMHARQDAQIFVTDGDSFMEAAAGDDDLAALLLSPWGEKFLRTRPGIKDPANLHMLAQHKHIENEAHNNNPYAQAYLAIKGRPMVKLTHALYAARRTATKKAQR